MGRPGGWGRCRFVPRGGKLIFCPVGRPLPSGSAVVVHVTGHLSRTELAGRSVGSLSAAGRRRPVSGSRERAADRLRMRLSRERERERGSSNNVLRHRSSCLAPAYQLSQLDLPGKTSLKWKFYLVYGFVAAACSAWLVLMQRFVPLRHQFLLPFARPRNMHGHPVSPGSMPGGEAATVCLPPGSFVCLWRDFRLV